MYTEFLLVCRNNNSEFAHHRLLENNSN